MKTATEQTEDVGMNEGALGMIEHGYTEETRCLHFRVHFYQSQGAKAACRMIESYNAFDGDAVAEALDCIEDVDWIDVGREYSPVVYVKTGDVTKALEVLREAQADEVDRVGHNVVRAWWD